MFISKRKYNQMLDYIEELERNHLRDRGCITWLKGKIDGLKNIKEEPNSLNDIDFYQYCPRPSLLRNNIKLRR